MRSWLVMQGWEQRDLTVKGACLVVSAPTRLSSGSDPGVIFAFLLSGNKTHRYVCRCADRAWCSGLSRWFGPFSGPGKKSAGMQPTLLVTTGRRHNVDGWQILYRSKFNAPYLASTSSWLLRGGLAIAPTSIAWQSRPNTPHRVPVVKTRLLIPLWLMTGLLEISSLFLSRPSQALFAS